MQLRNKLYKVIQKDSAGLKGSFVLELNPSCFIYQAHFPGEPITPGVCIVQMGKELLEELLGDVWQRKVDTEITKVKNVKFLSVISPNESTVINFQIKKVEVSEEDPEIKAQISVLSEDEAKAKMSLVLREKC